MILALAVAFPLAHAAEARLVWANGVGHVEVSSAGEHVSPDAPSRVVVGEVEVSLRGDPRGVAVPVAAGAVTAEVSVALCADNSTTCRPVAFAGAGEVRGRRGSFVLVEGASAGAARGAAAEHGPIVPLAADALPSGVVKVIDFGAVWCPPCNLLAAEVLHEEGATAGIPVEAVDVDRADSWALKAKYAVGGYPTLVAVDAAGRVVDRLVGYPGAAPTRAWFGRLGASVPLDVLAEAALAGKAPPTVGAATPASVEGAPLSGAAAASAARRLAEGERPDAAKVLFAVAEDNVDLRVARLLVEPSEADAAWLFDHHAAPGDWVYAALEVAPDRWLEAVALAATVPPAFGADLLYVAGEHAPHDTGHALKAASLALLKAALSGDPEQDRGNYTFLAELMVEIGDLDGGVAFLDEQAARWPEEFTFKYAAAHHLLDAGKLPAAEQHARAALQVAWGDQRLRAAAVLARVLAGRGQTAEAALVIDMALREAPAPAEDVQVRTHRYRKELERLRAEITK